MCITSRIVKVAIPDIQEAMTSKEYFDALAFCLLVKLNIKSSVLHHATIRRLRSMTGIGSDRLRKILDYCKRHNMIVIHDDKSIEFLSLTKNSNGVSVYKFKHFYYKRNHKESDLRFNLSITKVKNMMRKAALAFHLKEIGNIRQQVLLTKNPTTMREFRKGRRCVKRLAVWGCDFFISNKRMANIANCSISTIQKVKHQMLASGEIERNPHNTYICKASQFNLQSFKKYCDSLCYLFVDNGNVYRHDANVYEYKGNQIAFVLKKNK